MYVYLKKSVQYEQHIRDIKHAFYTPIVLPTTSGMEQIATTLKIYIYIV